MKLIVGNFKNKLDFKNTKTLLTKYQASFLHENVGFCIKQEYFNELNLNEFSNLQIFCNNIDIKDINKSVKGKNYLIGHFDYRSGGETNKDIIKKTKKLLKNGARVLLCVGESLDEYNSGLSKIALKKQLKGLKPNDNLVIVYEPFYAIGALTPALLNDVLSCINFIKSRFFGKVQVLYGGSLMPQNASEFINNPFIDGILVGRASLNFEEFSALVKVDGKY